jgi:hypothetical protein
MTDRPAINEHEAQARESLVSLADAMLEGRVTFFEGAAQVLRLKSEVSGINEGDAHFDAFLVIASETDHLPLSAQQHLWNAKALADLRPEFERTEKWASGFASAACRGLIGRFRGATQ